MISLLITEIRTETSETKSFCFKVVEDSVSFEYKAGQFITLVLFYNNVEQRRSYSLSSTPGVDQQPCITVKRIQNGAISRYLYTHLKVGDIVQALPPASRFTLHQQAGLFFFIAAGSGITPIFSQIKYALNYLPHGKVILVYQNRNETQSVFRKQLLDLSIKYADKFQLIELFSQPEQAEHKPQRLNNYLLEQLVLQQVHTSAVQFYVCGPKAFMLIIKFTLRLIGYTEEQIFKENFVIDYTPPPPLHIDKMPHTVTINLYNRQYKFEVQYPENILEAALKHNLQLPFSCRGGRCSTCMATCKRGTVTMSINEVLTDQDLEKGFVLTCVGYPETDVELFF